VRRELFVAYIAPLHYDALRRRRGGGVIMRSLSSLGRRDSRVLRALELYAAARAIPASPAALVEEAASA
jgi:hypothetical protein